MSRYEYFNHFGQVVAMVPGLAIAVVIALAKVTGASATIASQVARAKDQAMSESVAGELQLLTPRTGTPPQQQKPDRWLDGWRCACSRIFSQSTPYSRLASDCANGQCQPCRQCLYLAGVTVTLGTSMVFSSGLIVGTVTVF